MDLAEPLLSAMTSGVTSSPPWQEFVHLLRGQFCAVHANVIFRNEALATNHMTESWSLEIRDRTSPVQAYAPHEDPMDYYGMAPFKAHTLDDFIERGEGTEHPFIKRFLEPLHIGSVVLCRIVSENGFQAWLSVARDRDRPFGKAERGQLETIARLFRHSLQVFGELRHALDQRDAYARLARGRATGLIRLGRNGKVLTMDASARVLTSAGGPLRVSRGTLEVVDDGQREPLRRSLDKVLHGDSSEELVAVEGNGAADLELLLFRTSDSFAPAWAEAPQAIIYVREVGKECAPSPRRIRALLGLSHRESMLASLLSAGNTITEASRQLGISEQTGRSYLRHIFERTGLTRQTELVRKIQASVVNLD